MHFNKPMIDLVREIRKQVGADSKSLIKLANPELFSELVTVCQQSENNILKTLIKELFSIAEDGWLERLAEHTGDGSRRNETRVYRGQITSVRSVSLKPPVTLKNPAVAAQKMYRGRPVG